MKQLYTRWGRNLDPQNVLREYPRPLLKRGSYINLNGYWDYAFTKDFKKPDQVHTLFPSEIERKMWPLPVSELFGVGRATTVKLHRMGLYTIGDLAAADESYIWAMLKKPGQILQRYARGGDLEAYTFTPANKGYGNSLTAPQDIISEEYARHLLLSLAETIGARLREDNVTIRVVCVHITTFEFVYYHKQMQLMTATNVTEEIYKGVKTIFEASWKEDPIRNIGVRLGDLKEKAVSQMSLFEESDVKVVDKVEEVMDSIIKKYGKGSVIRASKKEEDYNIERRQ